jgi:hypothetical protein
VPAPAVLRLCYAEQLSACDVTDRQGFMRQMRHPAAVASWQDMAAVPLVQYRSRGSGNIAALIVQMNCIMCSG